MRRRRPTRPSGLLRSLTLLRTFLAASALILAAGGFTIATLLASGVREQALADNRRDVQVLAQAALAPRVVERGRLLERPRALRRRLAAVPLPVEMHGLNLWSRSGRLLYSARSPRLAGRAAPPAPVREALRSRHPLSAVVEARGGRPRQLKVWTPLRGPDGRTLGVVEAALDERVLDEAAARFRGTIGLAVLAVFALLWLALALLVRGASARLRLQNDALHARSRELAQSARALERTLVQTIETLNAAVEARDPYTAGHSQRVRRVALAIGRELGLDPRRLAALGTAALFHDIGKIGIPDAILTKAGPLSPQEAAVMREHVTRGAEIVARISSLQDSVPAIRHHHERWDGLGYPDGLSGEEIPLEAAIVALADAWDAMTTDRPYAVALQLNEAMLQIRAGRGKQFSPQVVDAFWKVARSRPAEVLPPEAPTAAVAVV